MDTEPSELGEDLGHPILNKALKEAQRARSILAKK